MDRRDFLKCLAGGAAISCVPRILWGGSPAGDPFWIQVQGQGGWDTALFCDPKPALRMQGLNRPLYVYGAPTKNGQQAVVQPATSTVIRQTPGGGISYLGFADFHADLNDPNFPYKPFLPNYYDRVTIFNGVETGTLNHDIGTRYCASGSSNEGFPCFGSQVAAARGPDRPLSFMNLGGYSETAGMLAAQPLQGQALPNLARIVAPNDASGSNSGNSTILDPSSFDLVQAAHTQRLTRLRAKQLLPGARDAIDSQLAADAGLGALSVMKFNGSDQSDQNVMKVGIDAFRQGLATSMNIQVGGFDSHGDNEQTQILSLFQLFETVKFLLAETEAPSGGKAPVPAVIVVTSDFGRSPYYRNAGTDHWPVTSMMIVQNTLAKQLGLGLPVNTVIGSSTDGDELHAMRSQKLDPVKLIPDPNGVTLTPGHIMRALRRLAKIDGSSKLSVWPLSVDKDLAIG